VALIPCIFLGLRGRRAMVENDFGAAVIGRQVNQKMYKLDDTGDMQDRRAVVLLAHACGESDSHPRSGTIQKIHARPERKVLSLREFASILHLDHGSSPTTLSA
jgi:hypothetical protein